jgi:hypothetical protein
MKTYWLAVVLLATVTSYGQTLKSSVTHIDFGNVVVGTTSPAKVVTITNGACLTNKAKNWKAVPENTCPNRVMGISDPDTGWYYTQDKPGATNREFVITTTTSHDPDAEITFVFKPHALGTVTRTFSVAEWNSTSRKWELLLSIELNGTGI